MGFSLEERSDEEQLVLQAQHGCSGSFGELIRRYQVPLLHFLRQRTGGDCEDIVQETFLRAYRNLDRYRPAWKFSTWLFTIARRLSVNEQNKRRPAADSEAIDAIETEAPSPDVVAAEEESRTRLWDIAAATLSESQFTAIYLYYVHDMPVKEIARVLQRSRGAVKKMLFAARKRLLPRLRDLESEERAMSAVPASDDSQ